MLRSSLIIFGFLVIQSADAYQCFNVEEVRISEIHPPIHVTETIVRKNLISLRMPVDCHSKKTIQPGSEKEAIDWLDMALPMDLKRGALKGTYISLYANTDYGASAEEDLSSKFTSIWGLKNKELCNQIQGASLVQVSEASCFFKLLNKWREFYIGDN